MSRHWRIDAAPTAVQLEEIAGVLAADGVVLLPTDTIYGLHGLAASRRAVDRIASMKGREETKPFIVIACSLDQIEELGVECSGALRDALAEIWPAPLTAILRLREPIAASRGASTLAVRIPALDWLRELAARSGPLVSTSANRSGEPPVTSPSALAHDLHQQLDAIVDAGPLAGAPSAIFDLAGGEPRLLREGEDSFTQKVWKTLRKTL
jgi:L-threonylcarbamoyladenylate synthase